MLPTGAPERVLICATEGWFVLDQPTDAQWSQARVRLTRERPAIHLQDLIIGARVVGTRSYAGENLLMLIFRRWRSFWLERGDLLIVQPDELALISNQSAIPGEPEIRLLTLAHPCLDSAAIVQAKHSLYRLQGQRRLFGLGLGIYRHRFLQSLGVEPLPLSSRYLSGDGDSLWNHVSLNYPEALLCLESHLETSPKRPNSHALSQKSI
jgi:hypothetical protein